MVVVASKQESSRFRGVCFPLNERFGNFHRSVGVKPISEAEGHGGHNEEHLLHGGCSVGAGESNVDPGGRGGSGADATATRTKTTNHDRNRNSNRN